MFVVIEALKTQPRDVLPPGMNKEPSLPLYSRKKGWGRPYPDDQDI